MSSRSPSGPVPASPTPSRRGTGPIWRPRLVKGAHACRAARGTSANPALVVEAVKLAEDGSGDVVVRLYESLGERSAGRVSANFEAGNAYAVDLLERPVDAPGVTAGRSCAELVAAAVPARDAQVRALGTAAGLRLVQEPLDELPGAFLARCPEDLGGRAALHHHTRVHEDDFVGDLASEREFVRDDRPWSSPRRRAP